MANLRLMGSKIFIAILALWYKVWPSDNISTVQKIEEKKKKKKKRAKIDFYDCNVTLYEETKDTQTFQGRQLHFFIFTFF